MLHHMLQSGAMQKHADLETLKHIVILILPTMLLVEIFSFGLPLKLSRSKCVFISSIVSVANLQHKKKTF